jgi:hypothetical protein
MEKSRKLVEHGNAILRRIGYQATTMVKSVAIQLGRRMELIQKPRPCKPDENKPAFLFLFGRSFLALFYNICVPKRFLKKYSKIKILKMLTEDSAIINSKTQEFK